MTLPSLSTFRIGPRPFSLICLACSATWLVIVYPCLVWLAPNRLPKEINPALESKYVDFNHYYVGGFVVREGMWDSLYPIPKADIYDKPNGFIPVYQTFLFDPATARRNLSLYPSVSDPVASSYSPKLTRLLPEAKNWRYIEPPPAALFFWPLSFFSFETAARYFWPTLSSLSLFLAAWIASRIHRTLRQKASYTEGLIILACTVFSYRGDTGMSTGNNTPLLSALIALSIYALMRNRMGIFSIVFLPLVLFKPVGLMWLPCLLLHRTYWRSIAYLAIGSLLLNAIVIGLAGFSIYEKFFYLAPKIAIPIGMGLVPRLRDLFGYYPSLLYSIIELGFLAVLYYGYWRNSLGVRRDREQKSSLLYLGALLAGTTALFCLFNFVVWLHYSPNYLFFPFLGWILQEGYLAPKSWRYSILGGVGFAFLVMASKWFVNGAIFHLFGPEACSWYFNGFYTFWITILIPAGFLLVALRRLLFCPAPLKTV